MSSKKYFNLGFSATNIEDKFVKIRASYLLKLIYLLFFVCFIKISFLAILGVIQGSGESIKNQGKQIRHDIVDRNGNVLALNIPSTSIFIRPKEIIDKEPAIIALVKSLKVNEEQIRKVMYSNASFAWVKRNVTEQESLKLRYYGILGIYFEKEQKRFYPYNNLFAHTVGMTNIDNKGISGIENSFNEEIYNENIKLSLDLNVQMILHETLVKAQKNNQAKAVYGIIIDPNTSEVLAMVSLPDFNPNDRKNINVNHMFNNVSQGLFEPGSIIKILTASTAIDTQSIAISDLFDVSKPIVKNNFLITDFSYMNKQLTTPEVLMYSSNIGSSMMAMKFGVENQREYLNKFRIFQSTSLELSEKETSLLPKKWDDLTSMVLSYGYGIAMSQATFANAFTAVINGGVYRPLTLLKANNNEIKAGEQIISPDTSRMMRAMLRLTVAMGYGKKANVVGYAVAGKTGSAEKQTKGKYLPNSVIASFAGVFPAYNPKYVVVISVDEPKRVAYNGNNITGGTLATPIMYEIVEKLSTTFGIAKNDDKLNVENRKNQEYLVSYVENMPDITTTEE